MSGGLAKNSILMQLIANACNMPVQLPYSSSASVVLGAAMLGAAASEEAAKGPIDGQVQGEQRGMEMRERLWNIMVRFPALQMR